jgi:uncharacterized membrane protein
MVPTGFILAFNHHTFFNYYKIYYMLINPLAILLISIMLIFLVFIAILAKVLNHLAKTIPHRWKNANGEKRKISISKVVAISVLKLLLANSLFAQNQSIPKATSKVVHSIRGLPVPVFYTMISVIFLEFLIAFIFWISIYWLKRSKKETVGVRVEAGMIQA